MSEENERLYEGAQRRLREVTTLYEVSQACLSISDQKGLLTALIEAAARATDAILGSVMLVDEERGEYVFGAHCGLSQETIATIEAELHIPLGKGLVGAVVTAGQPVVVADVTADPRWIPSRTKELMRSFLGVPLIGRDGRPLGALNLARPEVDAFDEGHARLLSTFANQAAMAIENARLYEQAQQEITERKRAIEALRESEERYRRLVELSFDAIAIHREGKIVYINAAGAELFGVSNPEELVGKPMLDFVHPEHLEIAKARMLQATDGKVVPLIEEKLIRIDGTRVDAEVMEIPITYQGQSAVQFVARDITERKRAEEGRERRSQELAMLNEIGRAVTSSLDLKEVLALLLDRARQALGAEACSVALLDEDGDLVFHHAEGGGAKAVIGLRLKLGQGIAGRVAQSGQSALVPDAHADPHFYGEVIPSFTTRDMVCVPLVVRDEIIGVIELINKCQGIFTKDAVRLLESVAAQAAAAIENARLFGEARQRVAELEALQRTSLQITSLLDLSPVLDSIAESALTLVGATDCHIYLYDEASETFTFGAALWENGRREAAVKTPRRDGFTATVAREGRPMVINDAAHHPLYTTPEAQKWNLQAIAGFPLKRAGRVLGVFNIAFLEPHTFSKEELRVLGLLADQAAVAVENARLYEMERNSRQLADTLSEIAQALSSTLSLKQVLNLILAELERIVTFDSGSIMLLEGKDLLISAVRGFENPDRVLKAHLDLDMAPLNREVVESRCPLLLSEVHKDERWLKPMRDSGLSDELGPIRSWMGVPLVAEDKVIGMLTVDKAEVNFYSVEDTQIAQSFANQAAIAIVNARLYERARWSEERYRDLFENANDLIFTMDRDFNISDVNKMGERITGYSVEEVRGMNVSQFLSSKDLEQARLLLADLLAGEAILQPFEAEIMRRDGGQVLCEITGRLIEKEGQPVGVHCIARDVTGRQQAEERLRQAQKMEAIGQLAGGLAHDFNNLLTPIGGFADLLMWKTPEDSREYEYLRQIKGAAKRAVALTSQLLALARRAQVEMHPLSLNDIVHEVIGLLERTIDRAIAIEPHLADDLATVEGDAGQLHQVLLNLCLNARDAMPDGGRLIIETRNVTLSEGEAGIGLDLEAGQYVLLSVTDTGSGMDAETQRRLFEPFFTTKEQGRGLGLAMVYGIVHGHGGAIHVYSEPGWGSTFKVYLPVASRPAEDTALEEADVVGGTETVLVVDDEEPVRALLQSILEEGGYTVLLARDGVEATELYAERSAEIDLVVLDIIMPRMGGRETYERLWEVNPEVKVLLSSGYSEDGQAQGILAAGAGGFLQKPYDLRAVLRKVREVLEG